MKRNILLLILLSVLLPGRGQGYQIEVTIEGLPDTTVYLSAYYKSDYNLIDSARAANSSLYFFLEENAAAGMYRITIGRSDLTQGPEMQPSFIEFIWDHESMQVFADMSDLGRTVAFENSMENELLRKFRIYEEIYERKMGAVFQVIERYPESDTYFLSSKEHFLELQEGRDAYIQQLCAEEPDSYASKIIDSYRSLSLSPDLKGSARISFLKAHYFDIAPIDDPDLLHAPVYGMKIIEYLKLYRGQDFTFSEQEKAFIEATDMIMANVSGDIELRAFVVEYLLEGFESFGMENAQTYIVDNYVDETCTTDLVELAKQRVTGYRNMAVGQVGADILIRSYNDEIVKLSELDSELTLVLFWATHCPHCTDMMSKLKKWYLNEMPENMEIFAVSIDTVKSAWLSYLEKNELPWINAFEALGWEGKSAEDYNIYATPTMFLLDRQRKIILKPYTLRELKKYFK